MAKNVIEMDTMIITDNKLFLFFGMFVNYELFKQYS